MRAALRASLVESGEGCCIYCVRPAESPAPAPPGLEDLWGRVDVLVAHLQASREDEERVLARQLDVIRDGYLPMPSPFAEGLSDKSVRSWLHENQFYYEFRASSQERYFWITGPFSSLYCLETIWFPNRGIAVTIKPSSVDCGRLARFQAMLDRAPHKLDWGGHLADVPRTAVVGFEHLMHMLWNELPALDSLVGSVLPDAFDIAVRFEPFGPTRELFPELSSRLRTLKYADTPQENATRGLLFSLVSWTITRATQERVRRVAARRCSPEAMTRRDQFKGSHDPVFWLSVKPPQRTMFSQPEILAGLIGALRSRHPNAGFILDGASLPWDFAMNTNYAGWCAPVLEKYVRDSAPIIADVLDRLDATTRDHVVALNGISACEEAVWGEAATFYICHGGTMQNKIGWLHRIPGLTHSNRSFLKSWRTDPIIEDGPPCYFASSELVLDDDDAHYSPSELARADQNYSFTSLSRLVDEVLAAFAASRAVS